MKVSRFAVAALELEAATADAGALRPLVTDALESADMIALHVWAQQLGGACARAEQAALLLAFDAGAMASPHVDRARDYVVQLRHERTGRVSTFREYTPFSALQTGGRALHTLGKRLTRSAAHAPQHPLIVDAADVIDAAKSILAIANDRASLPKHGQHMVDAMVSGAGYTAVAGPWQLRIWREPITAANAPVEHPPTDTTETIA